MGTQTPRATRRSSTTCGKQGMAARPEASPAEVLQ